MHRLYKPDNLFFNSNTCIHSNHVLRVAQQWVEVHLGNLRRSHHQSGHSCNLLGIDIHIDRLLTTHALQDLISTELGVLLSLQKR